MDEASLQRALAGISKVSEIARREMFQPEAAKGNENTLWETMSSSIHVLSYRYAASNNPIQLFEAEIRDIWYLFTLAAQNIDAEHPAQDRLLRLILWARERGTVQRTVQVEDANEPLIKDAMTSRGRIWVDLPFFVEDVQIAWKELMDPSASPALRCNLTAAIARLAGLGVCHDVFSQCGLQLMKQALETSGGLEGDQPLALVEVWLRYAGEKLLRLSLAGTPVDHTWAVNNEPVGALAREAGIAVEGFSQQRFLFWKNQLAAQKAEIADETAAEARCANMITAIWGNYFGVRTH